MKHHKPDVSFWGGLPSGVRELVISVAAGLIITAVVAVSVKAKKQHDRNNYKSPLHVQKQVQWKAKKRKK